MRVFISSTYEDLIDEREAVCQALKDNFEVVRMEDFGSRGEVPIETCLQAVEESDVYVLILGRRYGTIHPEYGQSYTYIEHERAMECGLHVLAYIHEDIDEAIAQGEPDEAVRLEDFRREIESSHTVHRPYFSSPDMLAEQVKTHLLRYQKSFGIRPFFGRRSAAIEDPIAYGVGGVRFTKLRMNPLVVFVVDLSVLAAQRYPRKRGRRMREKVQSIVTFLDRVGANGIVFNEIPAPTAQDVVEQRVRQVKKTAQVVVCLVRGNADKKSLPLFAELAERRRIAVWHPDGIDVEVPSSVRTEEYSETDLQECGLARHVTDYLTAIIDEHLASTIA